MIGSSIKIGFAVADIVLVLELRNVTMEVLSAVEIRVIPEVKVSLPAAICFFACTSNPIGAAGLLQKSFLL